ATAIAATAIATAATTNATDRSNSTADCSNSASDRSSGAATTSGSKATAAGAVDAHAEAEQLLFRQQGQIVIDQAQQLMTAMAAAAARATAYADAKLHQLFLGQHIESGLDSADQVGSDGGIEDTLVGKSPNCGRCSAGRAIDAVDCATDGA